MVEGLSVILALLAVLADLALAGRAGAAVILTASRSELLYSTDAEPDCSALSKNLNALPFNVTRVTAVVDGAPPEEVRYRWSFPQPAVGTLAADLDLGPSQETPAIQALCAEFGNACTLTKDTLPLYNYSTILWLAPTCDILPPRTSRNFRGGTIRLRVVATAGRRRLGKARITIGYGRTASVTLYANGKNGIGQPGGIPSDIRPSFGAVINQDGETLPLPESVEFDSGGGAVDDVVPAPCSADGVLADACTNNLLYDSAGRFLASVMAQYADGSALCDNVTVRVLACEGIPRLQVVPTPRRSVYRDGDTVNLQVRLHNASPRQGGCGFLLTGSSVLTCDEQISVSGTTATKTTTFDLQHCSETTERSCTVDGHCQPPSCQDCGSGEICLTASHCSSTITRPCDHDADCSKPACQDCEEDETCVHVLAIPEIDVPVGQTRVLFEKSVPLVNVFPDVARIGETWTVNTFNAGSDDAKLRYRIRGRR